MTDTEQSDGPTDQQLESFIRVMLDSQARRLGVDINADFGARMVMQNQFLKELWLQRHRDLQQHISKS